jgi:hypothetical protein
MSAIPPAVSRSIRIEDETQDNDGELGLLNRSKIIYSNDHVGLLDIVFTYKPRVDERTAGNRTGACAILTTCRLAEYQVAAVPSHK